MFNKILQYSHPWPGVGKLILWRSWEAGRFLGAWSWAVMLMLTGFSPPASLITLKHAVAEFIQSIQAVYILDMKLHWLSLSLAPKQYCFLFISLGVAVVIECSLLSHRLNKSPFPQRSFSVGYSKHLHLLQTLIGTYSLLTAHSGAWISSNYIGHSGTMLEIVHKTVTLLRVDL